MDYTQLGLDILSNCGGANNVNKLTHCATRLRFEFNDKKIVNRSTIEKMPGVISVVDKGGQYQIIIGNDVQKVYKSIIKEIEASSKPVNDPKSSPQEEGRLIDRLISVMSTTFTPMIPALIGGGMVKAVLAVLTLLNLIDPNGQTYYILNLISDSAFYFMPILLAYGAAIKFECSPALAITIAGVLLHPSWNALVASGEAVHFFGIPVTLAEYGSSVLPIIFTVWIMSYIERFAEKVSPSIIKFFSKPLITVLLTAPLALVVIGPIGTYMNDFIAFGASAINARASWLIPLIMGTLQPLLLLTGTAWAMTPIATMQLAERGSEIINGPGMLASNIASGAATLAVGFKTKNKELKQIANSAGITGVIGIVEPALYSVMLPYKTPLIAAMIGGGAGGFYAGMVGMVRYAFVSPGLAGLPAFIGENPMNIVHAVITCAISFTVAFAVVFIVGIKEDIPAASISETAELLPETKDIANRGSNSIIPGDSSSTGITSGKSKSNDISSDNTRSNDITQSSNSSSDITSGSLLSEIEISSPLSGRAVPLFQVNDDVFSSGVLGKGIAILPEGNKIIAPIDGTITVFDTKHAIGIKGSNGVELMIHVGLDTVNLEGKYFESYHSTDDLVKKGDTILTFDKEKIQNAGFDIITPVIITNSDEYSTIDIVSTGNITQTDRLLVLKVK